ncbi:hypothetical protein [Microbacterium sp. TPD7012]|uniref:hypothetical protein n=1 Tax=Microbacterium sp. TPD7012 TaxID=2171975 RepID=UPI001FAEAD0B|nr:hypothetical protein [Microbacterium sp. TPD7012]
MFTPPAPATRMNVGISVACIGTMRVAMIDHSRALRPGNRLRARAYAAIAAVKSTMTTETTEYTTEFHTQSGNSPTRKIRMMLSKVSASGIACGIVGASAGDSARITTAISGATVNSEITMSATRVHVWPVLRRRRGRLVPGTGEDGRMLSATAAGVMAVEVMTAPSFRRIPAG